MTSAVKNTILVKMLDRLFAGLASGPNLNCRPHSSRQRIDWTQLARLADIAPGEALRQLLSDQQATQLQARVDPPPAVDQPVEPKKGASGRKGKQAKGVDLPARESSNGSNPKEGLSPEEQKRRDDWSNQQSLLTKLRGLAEDAREYEQDTGVHVLHIGFPLLSLPPRSSGPLKSSSGGGKRLLAPIAFVSVSLQLQAGPNPKVTIKGLHDGADFLVPNEALFAWLERQTGIQILPDNVISNSTRAAAIQAGQSEPADAASAEQTTDDDANSSSPEPDHDSWEELNDLVRRVSEALKLPFSKYTPEILNDLRPAPRTDDDDPKAEIVAAAVIGLFPLNKQGLLRDMQAMVADPPTAGPIQSFLTLDVELDPPPNSSERLDVATPQFVGSKVESTRLISMADPCQARAVQLARQSAGLVVHGPPGTGKSQTITNMIGDHLVRGERVLLVCDKRTALDVVARRLEHLGLGSFCSLIHDAQHDQRNLYKQVREKLESLTDAKVGNRAISQLQTLDAQLQKSIDRLVEAWSLVMNRDESRGVSFHERMGQWLETVGPGMIANSSTNSASEDAASSSENGPPSTGRSRRRKRTTMKENAASTDSINIAEFQSHTDDLQEIATRAFSTEFVVQPWRRCAGISLPDYLQRPAAQIREDLAVIVECASTLDETCDDSLPPFDVPDRNQLVSDQTVVTASPSRFAGWRATRLDLADRVEHCLNHVDVALRKRWCKASKSSISGALQQLSEIDDEVLSTRNEAGEVQLAMVVRERAPSFAAIEGTIGDLSSYLETCGAWYAWIAFGARASAARVLNAFGLALNPANATRVRTFLRGVAVRLVMKKLLTDFSTEKAAKIATLEDDGLFSTWDQLRSLLDLLQQFELVPAFSNLRESACRSLVDGDLTFIQKLRKTADRAEILEELRDESVASGLFHADWLSHLFARACRGESVTDDLRELESRLDTLGDVLRIRDMLNQLPAPLRALTEQAIAQTTSAEAATKFIRGRVYTNDIAEWLKSNPKLQAVDGIRLTELGREVRRLQEQKQNLVREVIVDLWVGRQRQRLLAATGTRLNSLGADLRRRLTMRGERAMRLRQVISLGAAIEGGDPLFDLCPVWMASPETVAQIFPLEPLFDVVIFDEASQCRLEEALPVLTRAKRIVIAGDPKQLPPSRFFESAVVSSENVSVETDQDLFEMHQSGIEDLLSAALSLNIQESYLDVHYRSRNADLVEFSNDQFYGSRLQAIPGHPKNRVQFAPITLYPVGGIYEERRNAAEATQVCQIVSDLLRRAEPPSIGIACFNLTQRDLILEKLAELSGEDRDFAGRLAAARSRVGPGAFEGLFVKNLENVQGDERDHMIISTTYGPDPQGRFYKRFGPLGQAGGGRRLNVLVTRAREEVHLVTSIPADLYRNLPAIPTGQQPGGGWLLFAYLAYAEFLAEEYRRCRDAGSKQVRATNRVIENSTSNPSLFAREVARLVALQHGIGSDVHWGNDGFCVDVAFHHPVRGEDRTLGLLCDGTRFPNTQDPVEWDLFRTGVLEANGWQIAHCWSPEFFRDPEGSLRKFAAEAARIADETPDPEGIPVESD